MGESDYRAWLETAQYSKRTSREYIMYYRILSYLLEDRKLDQEVIDSFLMAKNNNVARAFFKNYLEFLNRTDLKVPKIRGRKARQLPKIIPQEEIKTLRYALYEKHIKYGIMFDLSYWCALRLQEVTGIQITDFNWIEWRESREKSCRLKITKATAKGKKERYVVVPPEIMEMIVAYVKTFPAGKTKLFINKSLWHKTWRDTCKKVLGKTYKLHEIRHTRATDWYREGKDIINIKNRLGHSSISTTQLYINPDAEKEIEAWEKEY